MHHPCTHTRPFVPWLLVVAATVAPAAGLSAPPSAGPDASFSSAQDLGELRRDLTDRYENKRRSAVRKLAEMGTEEAWFLVLGALEDPDAQVADEAQLQLANAGAPRVQAALLGREGLENKQPLVRMRVAELLGRSQGSIASADLLRAAGDKEPKVRRMALWSLERALTASRLTFSKEDRDRGALVAIAEKDRDASVRGAALFALAAWKDSGRSVPELQALLADGARSKGAEMRAAAAALLGKHGGPGGEALAIQLSRDESVAVRSAALAALVPLGTRAGAGALVDCLESEPHIRLRRRAAAGLERLSGLRGRLDPRPFRDWHSKLPEDWKAEDVDRSVELERGDTVASLYGLPILSDNFAVLIDMSGSMWNPKDGVVPKTLVDLEVGKLLRSLEETTRFNLMPYATEPTRIWERTDLATKRNVSRAVEWFEQNRLSGKGNLWDALELALEDPGVDTLVLFTDGAPTGGPHWNLHLISALIAERNRYAGLVIDVVLTENGDNKRLWRGIAESTGGLYTEVKS
ncbi:MAG: VWA domain-containing protein [Planctomycetaceae bacterium]|nr:VWA domain-containing protein [Planctomycetaceae bacterium]